MASLDSQGEIVATLLYTHIWEGKSKQVRFRLHLDLPLLLVYIAAFIWQTQWIIATEMVWLMSQKNPKCWNVFDNAGRVFFQNSCNLVVIGLQLSFVFFCKRDSAKLKRFLWRRIYIIYIPGILTICKRFVAFTVDLCDLLCFVCNLWTIAKRIEIILWPMRVPDHILDRFCHQYGISVIEEETPFPWNIPLIKEWGEIAVFAG